MRTQSSLQLYVFLAGRWELHAAFKENEREDAIAEGKQLLETGRISSVRLMLESYDPATNSTTDRTVFFSSRKGAGDTPNLSKDTADVGRGSGVVKKAKGGYVRSGSYGGGAAKGVATRHKKKKKRGVTREGIAKKMIASVGIAIVAGILVAFMVYLALPPELSALNNINFLVFTIAFLFALIAAAWVLLDQAEIRAITTDEKASRKRRVQASQPSARMPAGGWIDESDYFAADDDEDPIDRAERERQRTAQDERSEALLGEIARELDDEDAASAARDPLAEFLGDDAKKEKKEKKKKDKKEKAVEPEGDFLENLDDDDKDDSVDIVRDSAQDIVKFMGASLGYAAKNSVHAQANGFDQFNMFGVHLYLAGAAAGYLQKEGLPQKVLMQITERASGLFSGDPNHARRFVRAYAEYVNEPKNLAMYERGRDAMAKARQMHDEANGMPLVWALDEWNQKREQNAAPVAIMFTDIAGSTRFTQEYGDEESHKMVTAHNAIVREALRKFAGHEVKHTGDGIMASFKDAGKSVQSAIAMMRGFEYYNSTAKHPFGVRISINLGEAVEERGDYFGAAVQLSARINSVTDADQILVSDSVRQDARGQAVFVDCGSHAFKGFPEPIKVFEVPWRADGRVSARAAEMQRAAQ